MLSYSAVIDEGGLLLSKTCIVVFGQNSMVVEIIST